MIIKDMKTIDMKNELQKQIELLEKYNVTNYIVENNKITINGSLNLDSITKCDKDFLKNTTINGGLYLKSLKECDKDFLKNATINGLLDLDSIKECDKDFLKSATINGNLYLTSLTECDKDFLKNTTIKINGSLDIYSLKECDKDILRSNVKQLKEGYNKEKGYCFFDNILSKVLSVKETKGYTIYTTPFGFITQKDNKTAHGKTVKKAVQDLEFKFMAEKLKKESITPDTVITEQYYRIVTGACEQGVMDWKRSNNIDKEEMLAKDLLPILEKTNAYGLERFKELVDF